MKSRPLAILTVAALAGLLASGCSKSADSDTSASSTTSAAPAAASSDAAGSGTTAAAGAAGGVTAAASPAGQTMASTGSGDAGHGATIFSANCVSCHGAAGAGGGIGPSLKGEKSRKNQAAAIAWIKNPQPPMPKLYPSPLSEKDVADVASYVESL